MLKNVKLSNNCNYLVLKVFSLNKNSINSIFRKFAFVYFDNFKNHSYVTIRINIFQFYYEKNKFISYLKKENIYFNVLGVKSGANFLNYEFFIKNFIYKKHKDLKILTFGLYTFIVNYFLYFIKLYFIFSVQFSLNFNLLFFKCLQLNKQLLN